MLSTTFLGSPISAMMALMSASVGYIERDLAAAMPVKLMSPISHGSAPPKMVPP